MRLLNVRTKKLESFPHDPLPYAILSHLWGDDDDEVGFHDIAKPDAPRKKGYKKIEGCCTQALQDGLPYIWIDTCCIDRDSSAELSEAINSMYRWYQRSYVCYVYLDDVRNVEDPDRDDSAFSRSRWFLRGWTLQELIAPKSLFFFTKDWRLIGNRESLMHRIERITGIDSMVLRSREMRDVSIAQRMFWAAKRETTRAEDRTYSLLGLFRISMPAIYGEEENAFKKLQHEIMKTSDDQSLFAWTLSGGAAVPLPPQNTVTGLLASSPSQYANVNEIPYENFVENVAGRPRQFVRRHFQNSELEPLSDRDMNGFFLEKVDVTEPRSPFNSSTARAGTNQLPPIASSGRRPLHSDSLRWSSQLSSSIHISEGMRRFSTQDDETHHVSPHSARQEPQHSWQADTRLDQPTAEDSHQGSSVTKASAPLQLVPTAPLWLTEACHALKSAELSRRERVRYNGQITSINIPTSHGRLSKPEELSGEGDLSKYYSIAVGNSPINQPSNRNQKILPYDRTRVVVGDPGGLRSLGYGNSEGRYLNASWVFELYGGKLWIATQAPLPDTAHAFLSVLTQSIVYPPTTGSRVRTVVQLPANHEKGFIRAHSYFPSRVGETMTINPERGCKAPPLKVMLVEQNNTNEAQCLQSKVSIVPDGKNWEAPVIFTHMLLREWPGLGIAEDEASMLTFLRAVDAVNRTPRSNSEQGDDPDPPIIVTSSSGTGKTGTFIALSSLLRSHGILGPSSLCSLPFGASPATRACSPLGPLPPQIANDMVAQEVDSLREQRPGMVQTMEQLTMIYHVLRQGFFPSPVTPVVAPTRG
ncbi:phosphatases II [Gyrodon lividus]|nr:phosphatases II [Gyrodon lividus]